MRTGYPIIYLRGYAMNQAGVETTVDDPFYGFNTGSTHVRVGKEGKPEFFAFESPVLRLMGDHGYVDAYGAGLQATDPRRRPQVRPPGPRSIWIYRYYDPSSHTFPGSPRRRLEIEDAADALREFISQVKAVTSLDEPTERVVLIGHSTGGLIIRSLLQRAYPLAGEDPADHVDKAFTYATPQGGIHFDIAGGLLEGVRDLIGFRNSDDFGPDRMYQYLSPDAPALPARAEAPEGFEPRSLDGRFPAERFFSLVGTNAADYGPASRVVGPQSDGLVQVASAYVKGGPRAYVHRSHSGRYGVVNSEEGYQNLRRFLFGDMRVEILLDDLDLAEASAPAAEVFHQAEVQVAVRGLPVLLHDQLLAHHSPIPLEWRKDQEGEPIALFTLFLIRALAGETRLCRYAVHLAVHRLERRQGFLVFADHLEQIPLWADDLVVDLVETAGGYEGRYAWRSQQPRPGADPERDLEPVASGGRWEVRIGLPHGAHAPLGPDATLLMRASPWS